MKKGLLTRCLGYFLALFAAGALMMACSGGSSSSDAPSTPTAHVGFIGDSLTNGGLYDNQKLGVSPVVQMTQYASGRWIGVNYAVDGMRCVEHPVPAADHHAYVFRFGMADHVKGTTLTQLQDCLYTSINDLLKMGKTVYMVGIIHVPDPTRDQELTQWDSALKVLARSLGVPFIDVRSLGQVEMADDIHPNQTGSDRTSRLIADSIH